MYDNKYSRMKKQINKLTRKCMYHICICLPVSLSICLSV